mgnify:CR=1 FL=1
MIPVRMEFFVTTVVARNAKGTASHRGKDKRTGNTASGRRKNNTGSNGGHNTE